MVYLGYTQIQKPYTTSVFEGFLAQLPAQLQAKVCSFRRWEDAHLCLMGKILLKELANRFFNTSDYLNQLVYNDHQKPMLNSGLNFNISHSGTLVACALSETCQLGIDLEQVTKIDFGPYQDYMSKQEWEKIHLAKNPHREFLTYWTQKEAITKADGKGLSIPLNELKVMNSKTKIDQTDWHLKTLKIHSDYVGYLATDRILESDEIVYVDFFKANNATF